LLKSENPNQMFGIKMVWPGHQDARGLGRRKAYAVHLKPLIDEFERAGALNDWREGERAPITATNSSDPASSERSPQ
jgi:hypothetical protein